MTPEERAKGVLAAMATPWHGQPMPLSAGGHDPFWEDKEIIAAAIRAAVAEEREACARVADECSDSPDDHESGAAIGIAREIRDRKTP